MRAKQKQRAAETGEDELELEGMPLLQTRPAELSYLAINRDEPEEGYLGKLPPSASEAEMRKKWGGGTYTVTPRTARGNWIKGHPPFQVNIAGDPIFTSRAAELKWKRQQGLAEDAGAGGRGVISDKPLGFGELMLLMDKQAERARGMFLEQSQIREREAAAAHERQIAQIQAEAKRRESELAFERERLKNEAQEREGRLGREVAAERERQREHNATMLQLISEKGKQAAEGGAGVQTLIAGMKLAQELTGGGGGEGAADPLTAFAQNLPEIIEQGGKLIAMDKASSNQGKVRANPRAQKVGKDDVVLQGEVARKAAAVVKRLEQQGKDPARVLSRAFDVIGSARTTAPTAPAARAARAAARKPPPRRAPTPAAPKSPGPGKPATSKR